MVPRGVPVAQPSWAGRCDASRVTGGVRVARSDMSTLSGAGADSASSAVSRPGSIAGSGLAMDRLGAARIADMSRGGKRGRRRSPVTCAEHAMRCIAMSERHGDPECRSAQRH
jgi:hypothetical protein